MNTKTLSVGFVGGGRITAVLLSALARNPDAAARAVVSDSDPKVRRRLVGMILLAGIVVKNSILLIDFIQEARARGDSLHDALTGSVRVRTRPILMTAAGTAVGMLPIALEWAIGLERLSPLAVVAIGGLTVSTFLTLIYVPVFYDLFESARQRLSQALASRGSTLLGELGKG